MDMFRRLSAVTYANLVSDYLPSDLAALVAAYAVADLDVLLVTRNLGEGASFFQHLVQTCTGYHLPCVIVPQLQQKHLDAILCCPTTNSTNTPTFQPANSTPRRYPYPVFLWDDNVESWITDGFELVNSRGKYARHTNHLTQQQSTTNQPTLQPPPPPAGHLPLLIEAPKLHTKAPSNGVEKHSLPISPNGLFG
jgi:hypothetical protein